MKIMNSYSPELNCEKVKNAKKIYEENLTFIAFLRRFLST